MAVTTLHDKNSLYKVPTFTNMSSSDKRNYEAKLQSFFLKIASVQLIPIFSYLAKRQVTDDSNERFFELFGVI